MIAPVAGKAVAHAEVADVFAGCGACAIAP